MRRAWLAVLGAALLAAAPAAAQDDVSKRIINEPSPGAFTIYGLRDKPKVRKDATVQGGQSLRVAVPGKGETPFAVGLSSPVKKAVKKGDKLVLAFWARFDKAEGPSATIANVSVQLATPPYASAFAKDVEIGPEWKMYSVEGLADRDYAAGELAIAMHLATGKQVIDLGPIFLLDMSL